MVRCFTSCIHMLNKNAIVLASLIHLDIMSRFCHCFGHRSHKKVYQNKMKNIKPNFFRSTGGHYHDCDLSHPKEDTVNKPVHTPEQFGTILARKRPNNHSKASKRDHSRNSREQRHKHHEPWDDAQGRSDLALAHNSRITGHVKRNAAHSLPHKVGCQERYHVGTDDQAQCVLPLNNDPNDRHSHRHIHETYSNVR